MQRKQKKSITKDGKTYQVALWPTEEVRITQGSGYCGFCGVNFNKYHEEKKNEIAMKAISTDPWNGLDDVYSMSHQYYRAVDMMPIVLPNESHGFAYAPFDCKCVHHKFKTTAWITVYESLNQVYCADGTYSKVTFCMVHGGQNILVEKQGSTTLTQLAEGDIIYQGDRIYQSGKDGTDGEHIHLNVKKGTYDITNFENNFTLEKQYDLPTETGEISSTYALINDCNVEKVFFLTEEDSINYDENTGVPYQPYIDWVIYDFHSTQNGWVQKNNTWYYIQNSVPKKGWFQDTSGSWYYSNPTTGAMEKGWRASGSKWYYLNPANGIMATNTWIRDRTYQAYMYVGSDGAMYANTTKTIGGRSYTFNSSGYCTNLTFTQTYSYLTPLLSIK